MELRRIRRAAQRQAKKLTKSESKISARIAKRLQEHWKVLLTYFGISGIGDLIREFARGKFMDWLYSKLGAPGQWALTYPFALLTIAATVLVLYVIVGILREWGRQEESPVLDSYGDPFTARAIPTRQAFQSIAFLVLCIAIVGYGTYRYYLTSNATLLDKYPLGYVIFSVDSENSVFPYNGRGELANWNIDWSTFKYREFTGSHGQMVEFRPPNIRITNAHGALSFHDNTFDCLRKVGGLCGGSVLLSNGVAEMLGEILSTSSKGTVFLFGFKPSPYATLSAFPVRALYSRLGDAISFRMVSRKR